MNQQGSYYTYWGLAEPPFDKAPNPEMYFDLYRSVDHAVSETLFAIEEGHECIVLIVGGAGLGKTMALRVIIDSLEQEYFRIAFVTKPDTGFCRLLKEIIRQLSGALCAESRREQLLEIFRQLLLNAQAEGKKVLIFIDQASAMKLSNLESLKLLANMQAGDENLFTIILAGQHELARRLEHPKCASLFQRIGICCHLTPLESRDLMRDYIEHRLERAGSSRAIFTDEAYDAIWEYSENGVPRLINRIAKLALQAGQVQGLQRLDAGTVRQIGSRFDRASKAIRPKRNERGRDAGPVVQEKSVTPTFHEDLVASIPLLREAFLARVGATSNYPRAAGDAEERLAQGGAPIDQQGKAPRLADIIKFSEPISLKAKDLSADQRLTLAGQLAAELLKRYPHLIQQLGTTSDPVPAWTILRNILTHQLQQQLANNPAPASQA
jgi:type II secretory pathway predicted ATPase ExeA